MARPLRSHLNVLGELAAIGLDAPDGIVVDKVNAAVRDVKRAGCGIRYANRLGAKFERSLNNAWRLSFLVLKPIGMAVMDYKLQARIPCPWSRAKRLGPTTSIATHAKYAWTARASASEKVDMGRINGEARALQFVARTFPSRDSCNLALFSRMQIHGDNFPCVRAVAVGGKDLAAVTDLEINGANTLLLVAHQAPPAV